MTLTFGSLFAGIGGFDLGLTRAGFTGIYAAEMDAKCNSVRRRHWPDETQYTDVAFVGRGQRPDVLCAGWPCQGNSVAGKRAGMADSRSGLWGEVTRILDVQRPRWFLGENVPGILSVNDGKDWATVLADLGRLGYGFAYRILDAQWFGVPQRRRRVFVVGCLGDWRPPAEILFERESLPWDPAPRRPAKPSVAGGLAVGPRSGCGVELANTIDSRHSPNGHGARGTSLHDTLIADEIAYPMHTRQGNRDGDSQATLIAYNATDYKTGDYQSEETARPRGVRRLMPIECERLQGFPDDWTRYGADGEEITDSARYRMCGNAVAVPCIEWIARRLIESP